MVGWRFSHTQDSGLACGGGHHGFANIYNQNWCEQLSPATGTWNKTHTLRQKRSGHVSWATAGGVYLMGGWTSTKTSEKVMFDGSVEEGFSLKYETRLHSELN